MRGAQDLSKGEGAFSLLDENAIAAAKLWNDPYDFAYVERAIAPNFRDAVLADAPRIPHRGSYGLPNLRYGPNFGAVIDDLLSLRFRRLVERKFDADLSAYPPCIVMMGNTSGHYNEGYAHPDSKHKIITVLLGFSHECHIRRAASGHCAAATGRILPSSSRPSSAGC